MDIVSMKIEGRVLAVWLLLALACNSSRGVSDTAAASGGAGQGPAAEADPAESRKFIFLDLKGRPYERGFRHGKALREQIQQDIAIWKTNLGETFKADPDNFIRKFVAGTNYLPSIQKWTPELLEEVRGISDGSGVDFNTILVFQLVGEYWVNGGVISAEHCSAMATAGTAKHPGIVAQNMDLETYRDGFQTILRIEEPSGLHELILTQPGLIGFNGMNSRGVGVVVNTVAQLAHAKEGLPVAFVMRGALERTSYADVASFLETVQHASGQNYTVGTPGHAGYFEASAHKVVEVPGVDDGSFLYHTNHPVANQDYSAEGVKAMAQPDQKDNSHTRYQSLQKRLASDPGADAIEDIRGFCARTIRSNLRFAVR